MNKGRILIVDETIDILDHQIDIEDYLSSLGYNVTICSNTIFADFAVVAGNYDVVLLDLGKPNVEYNAIDIIRTIHDEDIDTVVIVLTAHGTYEQVVEAINLGVFYWFDKKDLDLKLLADVVEDACRVIPSKLQRKWLTSVRG